MNKPTAKQIADQVSDLVNGFDETEVLQLAELISRDHRTLQQGVMRGLVWPLLKIWAEDYKTGHYDLRNEDTVKLAHDIVTSIPEQGFRFV